jgi:hypothetical protein
VTGPIIVDVIVPYNVITVILDAGVVEVESLVTTLLSVAVTTTVRVTIGCEELVDRVVVALAGAATSERVRGKGIDVPDEINVCVEVTGPTATVIVVA